MPTPSVSPEPLLKMGTAFWLSKITAAAVQLNIFTEISSGQNSVNILTKALAMDERSLRAILNACAAIGLLKKDSDNYSNTDLSEEFLVRGKPRYFGDLIIMQGTRLYDAWGHLEDTLKAGAPPKELFSAMRDNNALSELFTAAMHNNAVGTAAQAASRLDLSHFHRLMDVGAGSGAYAITFARLNPNLSAYVVDLPTVCKVANNYISRASLDGRVTTQSADIVKEPLPSNCDVALVSQVLHSYSPEECKALLQKIYSVLEPNGMIIINEFFVNDDGTSPVFPVLFAVNMLLESEKGTSYTKKAVASWLSDVGFTDIHQKDLPGPSDLLVARKQ